MATLEGKPALVTGASIGIGRATAMALAGAGARVLVHYGRSAQEADNIVAANKFARSPATGWKYSCPTPASTRRRRSRIARWRLSTNIRD